MNRIQDKNREKRLIRRNKRMRRRRTYMYSGIYSGLLALTAAVVFNMMISIAVAKTGDVAV